MNARDDVERHELSKTFEKYVVLFEEDSKCGFVYKIKIDQDIFVVSDDIVLWENKKRLFDRNMVLMIKDTMVGRFCTKVSLYNRID